MYQFLLSYKLHISVYKSLNLFFGPIHFHYQWPHSLPAYVLTMLIKLNLHLVLKPKYSIKVNTNKLGPYIMFTEYLFILNLLGWSDLTDTRWENPNTFCNYYHTKGLRDRTIHRDWPLFCSGNHRNLWFHDVCRLIKEASTVQHTLSQS